VDFLVRIVMSSLENQETLARIAQQKGCIDDKKRRTSNLFNGNRPGRVSKETTGHPGLA